MKYPRHIILDINKPASECVTSNWLNSYRNSLLNDLYDMDTLRSIKVRKSNIKYFISKKNSTTKLINPKVRLPKTTTDNTSVRSNSLLGSLFDINFLKREKLYTKLKYSRSPQYDIVSGGVAALFSGFLGFLISEKFGIELVDSGDFYTFFMYCVFFSFSLRPLVKILNKEDSYWGVLSYKHLFDYLTTIIIFILRTLKSLLKKLPLTHFNFWFKVQQTIITNEYLSVFFYKIYKFIQFLKTYPKHK